MSYRNKNYITSKGQQERRVSRTLHNVKSINTTKHTDTHLRRQHVPSVYRTHGKKDKDTEHRPNVGLVVSHHHQQNLETD